MLTCGRTSLWSGCQSSGTGYPEGWWSLLLCRYSRLVWTPTCVNYHREPALAGGWTGGSPEVPSNPCDSVIWHQLGNAGLRPAGIGSSWKSLGWLLHGELSARFTRTMNKVPFLALKKPKRGGGKAGLCNADFLTIPTLQKGNTDQSWALLIRDRKPKISHHAARQVLRATQTDSVSCSINK